MLIQVNLQAALEKKAADAERRETLKRKSEGKQLLNKVNIPFAKAEADFASLAAMNMAHPLIPECEELLEEGKGLKEEAVKAMSGEASVDTTPQKVTEWLDKIKKQTKVVTTILKGK